MTEDLSGLKAVRVAIVSDTHGYLYPDVLAVVENCDVAVHAGDIGSSRVLDVLQAGAGKVVAVRGNNVFDTSLGARSMVNKVFEYCYSYGDWQNSFTLLSDDPDKDWEVIIQHELDKLGDVLAINKPFINVTKIHSVLRFLPSKSNSIHTYCRSQEHIDK